MDDFDLVKELSSSFYKKRDGEAYFKLLKEASFTDDLKDMASKRKDDILPAIIGAVVASGTQAILNSRKKSTGLSAQQEYAQSRVQNAIAAIKEKELNGETPGYLPRLNLALARGGKEISDTFADHPIRGALSLAPAGAVGGIFLRNLARNFINRG